MRYLFIILFIYTGVLYGQELQDSIKIENRKPDKDKEYNHSTVSYFYEDEYFLNRSQQIDTSLDRIHNYEGVTNNEDLIQDLGNIGTARRNLYSNIPDELGINLGLNAYSTYSFTNSTVRYYNTQSPYSKLRYVQGGKGQQIFEALINRNLNSRWNVGVDFRRLVSKQQAGTGTDTNQTNVFNFLAHTNFKSKNGRYRLLANISHHKHIINELGGGEIDSGMTKADLFDFPNVNYQLYNVETVNSKNSLHILNQYNLTGSTFLFGILDRERNRFDYSDLSVGSNLDFYDNYYGLDSNTINQSVLYDRYKGKVGIGYRDSLSTLTGYYRTQVYNYDHLNSFSSNWRYQNFIGGTGAIVRENIKAKALVEASLDGDKRACLGMNFSETNFNIDFIQNSPTLIQQHFSGDLYQWTNSFDKQSIINVGIDKTLDLGSLKLVPSLNISLLKNYIYFNEFGNPSQEQNQISTVNAGLMGHLNIGKFHLVNNFKFFKSNSNIIVAPEVFNQSKIYFHSKLFSSECQLGIETFLRSDWNPYFFNPVTQQFSIQSNFGAESYLVGDIFFNIRIKWAKVFVKMNHFNQSMMGQNGYFVSPNYTGLQRLFVFGINWEFFD